MELKDTLFALLAAPGITGAEDDAAAVASQLLSAYMPVRRDTLGSVIGETDGEGSGITLDAHLDQIGLFVTAVTDEGFVKDAPVIKMNFDKACYFITEHASSMLFDNYSEYLFDPQGENLIFSYTRAREEGNEYEWRYYFDENGKCIETKTNSEDTDDGALDKRSAREFQAIFNTLIKEGQE